MNTKYVVNGVVFHAPFEYDQYLAASALNSKKDVETSVVYADHKLIVVTKTVRPVMGDEMPSWMADQVMIKFEREETVMASYENGIFEFNDEFEISSFDIDSLNEIIDFLMEILYDKNRYLYRLITNCSQVNGVSPLRLTEGVLGMLRNPRKMTVIETMAKTIGEKMAINSIQNDIEVTSGKKAAVLSQDQLHSIKTLRLDNSLVAFQRMVQNGVLSIDQMDRVLQGMKYLIKFKFITAGELDALISRYEDDIVEKKLNLEVLLANTIKSYFNLYDITGRTRRRSYGYDYCLQSFKSIFSHYVDAIKMLPAEAAANPKYYRTNDVERYHGITTRNSSILQKPREEEFKLAAEKLRKLKYDDGTYIFAPFQTEEELFFVGQQYNNCLPVYRDKIIDDGAVLVCAYKKSADGGKEECPDFVFEVTPHLDVLEISSYNNEEVRDPDKIEAVRAFRKAKWYLLSKGRSVFRDPDEKDDEEINA